MEAERVVFRRYVGCEWGAPGAQSIDEGKLPSLAEEQAFLVVPHLPHETRPVHSNGSKRWGSTR